jgi:hypothetical protein
LKYAGLPQVVPVRTNKYAAPERALLSFGSALKPFPALHS